jgi:hydroxyacylglutathione hydrolase
MWLDVFDDNPYGTNCWMLAAEDAEEAVVIDPGFEPEAVNRLLEASGRRAVAVLATHGHVDHVGTAGAFAGELPVYVHGEDAAAFSDPVAWNSGSVHELAPVRDLRTMADGDVLRFGSIVVEVLHTPGHTPGHCCFRTDAMLFSGDLVFAGAIGRSDFPNSDPAAMRASLRRFLTLPDDLPVEPGHGPDTTVGRERATNPFLVAMR